MPWAYTRRQLAASFLPPLHPWELDEVPAREIALELRLREIEIEARR